MAATQTQIGALLFRDTLLFHVFGANTGVGKTIVSTLLLRHHKSRSQNAVPPWYIKPVSTGSATEADDNHIALHAPLARRKTIVSFDIPTSPHIAARFSKLPPEHHSDDGLLAALHAQIMLSAQEDSGSRGERMVIVEGAGGVLSPAPSGTPQADLYRPLRLPVVLVGDAKLGGISATISAAESLLLRGYDITNVVMFDDHVHSNAQYIKDATAARIILKNWDTHDLKVPVTVFPSPPQHAGDSRLDEYAMDRYYTRLSASQRGRNLYETIEKHHTWRREQLDSMPTNAMRCIWHPFMQHTERTEAGLTAIDSAYKDHFQITTPRGSARSLEPAFDGSASWWTQGLGHAHQDLALTAAYAAARYGHVMFANAIHKPALKLATSLLWDKYSESKTSRCFYTDNGSTGVEAALKMALRAAAVRHGWTPKDELIVLGLKGSYHGDTMGVMDCSEGNVYNEKVEWYRGRGHWLDFPKIKMKDGKYVIVIPEGESSSATAGPATFDHLADIFDFEARSQTANAYRIAIDTQLQRLVAEGKKLGALIMEPLILGAGGMLFADPLFQYELWRSTQRLDQGPSRSQTTMGPARGEWTGMPTIADEVFTGLYRLNIRRSSTLARIRPDIVVNAKLLTGGLLPLSATLASESIFRAFLSEDKADALLHGHSYTAHPVGCSVALNSLRELAAARGRHGWARTDWSRATSDPLLKSDEQTTDGEQPVSSEDNDSTTHDEPLSSRKTFGRAESNPSESEDFNMNEERTESLEIAEHPGQSMKLQNLLYSLWPRETVERISYMDQVEGTYALGTVLVIELKDEHGGGYTSQASIGVRERLMKYDARFGQSVHCRILGNVLYFMCSLNSTRPTLQTISKMVEQALEAEFQSSKSNGDTAVPGPATST